MEGLKNVESELVGANRRRAVANRKRGLALCVSRDVGARKGVITRSFVVRAEPGSISGATALQGSLHFAALRSR